MPEEKYIIKGFIPNTLIDWEGKIASVIYLPGCNFRCPYCHVSSLVINPQKLETIAFDEIKGFLKDKKGWIDGVVIGGGEPTIYPELSDLMRELKGLPTSVKLDTNGSNPQVLKSLIEEKLVDYIAMDIKAPLRVQSSKFKVQSKYDEVTGVKVDKEKIKESIEIIKNSYVDYEFRTTVVPTSLAKEDIVDIAKSISGAKRYILQQFVPRDTIDPEMLKVKPYQIKDIEEMAELARKYVKNTYCRGQ